MLSGMETGARSQTRSQREAAGRNGFISNRKQQIRIIEKKKKTTANHPKTKVQSEVKRKAESS